MKYDELKTKFEERNIHFEYVSSKEELEKVLNELIPAGTSVAHGGSMTLGELGVYDYLRNRDINFLDRSVPGVDVIKLYHEAFNSDIYVASSNAITENGEIFNIDGNGNRVAAMIYGPEKVILIVGENKLTKNLADAKARVKSIAAPKNGVRLKTDTPCEKTGMCGDCREPKRLCCYEVAIDFQRQKDRMYVIMVEGSYGY